MKPELTKLLICPKCKSSLNCEVREENERGEIIEGRLICQKCQQQYPVTNGIPRFVATENYASSFGYQWNLFRKEQLDSYNGTNISAERFWSETNWTKEEIAEKLILDAGCGAGRFLDVVSNSKAEVIGVDISSAIDAAKANLEGRNNIHFVQASIYDLPFREETFDFCYCIGVIQHTPDPPKALSSITRMIKEGGKIAVTIYERKPFTKLYSKYWLRPITKRIPKEKLIKLIETLMPVLFPITDLLFRAPKLGKLFAFLIPVANYVHEKRLTREQRYKWAILDTFDMLSPEFDSPMTEREAVKILRENGFNEISRLPNPGLNLVGKKQN
jgi:ubiquinone/menaquinone biosynthesis C-methylase UbiE/uncharacterized protein YbaR (Trm112 family)